MVLPQLRRSVAGEAQDLREDQDTGFSSSMSFSPTGCHFRLEIKYSIVMAKSAFKKKGILFTSKFGLNLRKKVLQCHIRGIFLCGVEI